MTFPHSCCAAIPAEMVETFTHLAFSPDGSDSAQLIEQLLEDGVPPETVMLELLAPAARLMGDMWTGDEANFLEVTLGPLPHPAGAAAVPLSGAWRAVADRGPHCWFPCRASSMCWACAMVEEFLMRDGWRVRCTPVANVEQLRQLVAAEPV